MTEQLPQPRENREKKQLRAAAFWAKRIERLEVSDVPEGAANVNVQGRRELGALQGFGKLWQKTYRVRLTDAEVKTEEAVKVWKEHFPKFQPPNAGRTFGVNEAVSLEKTCVDSKLQWPEVKNVWRNADAGSMLYAMVVIPGRWICGLSRCRNRQWSARNAGLREVSNAI